MKTFQGADINSLYVDIIDRIMKNGSEIVKDGRRIKELFNCFIEIKNPKEGILVVDGRPYNPAFLVAETIWNLAGDTDSWICNYNSLYKEYFTNNILEAGYGNRIFNWNNHINQFSLVAKRLREEPHTQHADITIFNPSFDLEAPKFVPCITKLKFRIRDNKLYMTSFMRAQDMWLGFPYDINLLLSIFQLMSAELNVEMGEYYHYCDVLRIYEKNFEQTKYLNIINYNCNPNIDFYSLCDFNKIRYYRDLIKIMPSDILTKIENEPEYWQNCIKICYAYTLLHKGEIENSKSVLSSITNCLKNQFEIWAKHYHKFFFEQKLELAL